MLSMRDIRHVVKYTLAGLMMLGLGSGCGTSREAKKAKVAAPTFIKADMARFTSKCDLALELCRYSILPDLGESKSGHLSMLGVIFTPADRAEASSHVQSLFGFQVASKKVRYRECQAFEIKVDGDVLPAKPVKYHQAMGRGQVVEGITVELSMAELKQISGGGEVRCELCGDERKLRGDEKVLLAHLFEIWRRR